MPRVKVMLKLLKIHHQHHLFQGNVAKITEKVKLVTNVYRDIMVVRVKHVLDL